MLSISALQAKQPQKITLLSKRGMALTLRVQVEVLFFPWGQALREGVRLLHLLATRWAILLLCSGGHIRILCDMWACPKFIAFTRKSKPKLPGVMHEIFGRAGVSRVSRLRIEHVYNS